MKNARRHGPTPFALAALLIFVPGCSIVPARSPPLEVRTFSAELPASSERVEHAAAASAPKLRLSRVNAAGNLHTRIVHRDSALELGEYEDLRWSEDPEEYVRRSLSRALFDERGIEQGIHGNIPTLDVEVVAFEEVRRGASRSGRVELRYKLHDDRVVLANGDIVSEQPARGADIAQIVEAISAALQDATRKVANSVVEKLGPGVSQR
jgi:cholesterol transport system auxiliary component